LYIFDIIYYLPIATTGGNSTKQLFKSFLSMKCSSGLNEMWKLFLQRDSWGNDYAGFRNTSGGIL